MVQDRVVLTVPARGEYAKTVRMTAASLVARLGVSYDVVDDVRVAAEEAFIYAADSFGETGEVSFTFIFGEDEILIDVRLGDGMNMPDQEAETRAAYATFILQAVCDRFEFSSDEDSTQHLRLAKRVGGVNAD